MARIYDWTANIIKEKFPEYQIIPYCPSGSWQTSRYIQIYIPSQDHDLHYEYRIDHNWDGRLELHFEGNWEEKYGNLIDDLMDLTQNNDNLIWSSWQFGYRCQLAQKIDNDNDLITALSDMIDLFDEKIKMITSASANSQINLPVLNSFNSQQLDVDLHTMTLKDVLQLPLAIPNYQRIYCWEKENVICLLDDVFSHFENSDKISVPYRLGTIILHAHDDKFDIIDGQQRLVTLSLLLNEVGIFSQLLKEKFSSKLSLKYVAYNKYLITNYVQRHLRIKDVGEKALTSIEFSVLVLKNTSIDLAYSFFSNQNSRGVELTDYDLLKAHHLRYIPTTFEHQSMRAAEVWNAMIEKGRIDKDSNETEDYACTLDTYIYRLRKWMRKKECDDSFDNYRVKREYEAAPIIEEIPPFGERFYFNEPIQGGTHFFSYVEQHLDKYHQFIQTQEYKLIHVSMEGGSNQWYRDVIESLLFGYYLKFGNYFLADALAVIMRIILQHRYDNNRAYKSSIIQHAGNSELILIIDQATSPTFFLAEAKNICKDLYYPARQKMRPIMLRLRGKASEISKKLSKSIVVESFKNINR